MLSSSVGYLSQTLQMAHNKKEYKARSIYKQVKKKNLKHFVYMVFKL